MSQSRDQVYHEDDSESEERDKSRDNISDRKTRNIEKSKKEKKKGERRTSRKSENQESQEKNESSEPSMSKVDTTVFQIRQAFITFFSAIDLPKGFVFSKKQRDFFRKEQDNRHRNNNSITIMRIKWKQAPEWKEQQEKQKIRKLFQKENFEEISSEKIEILQNIFLQSSYIFCNETTEELYRLLLEIVKCCIPSQNAKTKVRSFMRQSFNKANGYRFFTLSFTEHADYKPKQNLSDELIKLGEELVGYFIEYLIS